MGKISAVLLVLALGPNARAAQPYWTEWSGPVGFQRVAAPGLEGIAAPGAASNQAFGAAPALELERSLRGRIVNKAAEEMYGYDGNRDHMYYPDASPVPMDPDRIVEMNPQLWTSQQLLADFKEHGEGKSGFIILLKTEYCHKNKYRLCAVTTAALNKATTPLISRFKIYGAWLGRMNPKSEDEAYEGWQEQVTAAYRFDQGPGSNLFVIIPDASGTKILKAYRSDAARLELHSLAFDAASGETPKLHELLQLALSQAPK